MAIKRAIIDWVEDFEPTLEITLGANRTMSPKALERGARDFFNRIHRQSYGSRWTRLVLENPTLAVGTYEHPFSNSHLHVAVRASDRVQDRLVNGEETWMKVCPGGHFHAARIVSIEAFSRYMAKDAWNAEAQDALFLYSPRPV